MVRRNYLGFGVVIFLLGIIVTAMTAVGLHIESMVTVGVLAIIGGARARNSTQLLSEFCSLASPQIFMGQEEAAYICCCSATVTYA